MSRQARPQLSKSWSEAKGTCESARRRVGREADDLSQARLCLANRPAVGISYLPLLLPRGEPPRTPSVVYRPPSPTHRRNRGAASAYPYASKRGSKSRVGEQVDRLANQGRAFSYTRHRFSPPFSPLRRASEGRRPESESKSLICEPQGAKPPRTPAVVLRPLFSSGVLRKRGAASAYPHASKRGSKSRVGEQVDRLANQGRAFGYTLRRLSPPTLENRIEFVQVGFFGRTLVSCTGFFGCKHHHTKFTKIITKTRKKENSVGC